MAAITGRDRSDPDARAFQAAPDPAFLWRAEQYEHALSVLREGVLGGARLLVLTGGAGTGKTLVSRALAAGLGDERVVVGRLLYPALEGLDFVRAVAHAFGVPTAFTAREPFAGEFDRLLAEARARGRRVLLIIDEAQRITPQGLDEVRRLAAAPATGDRTAAPAVLLIGQAELLSQVAAGGLQPDVGCRLRALTREETEAYVAHRLRVAGTVSSLFTSSALQRIWVASEGVPRVIDLLCHRALTAVRRQGARIVKSSTVAECAGDVTGDRSDARQPWGEPRPAASHARRRRVRTLGIAAATAAVALGAGVIGLRAWPSRPAGTAWRSESAQPRTGTARRPEPAQAQAGAARPSESGQSRAAYEEARRGEIVDLRADRGAVVIEPPVREQPPAADGAPSPGARPARRPVEPPPRDRDATSAAANRPAALPREPAIRRDSAVPQRSRPDTRAQRDAADAGDPDAIIDWFLKEYAPKSGKALP